MGIFKTIAAKLDAEDEQTLSNWIAARVSGNKHTSLDPDYAEFDLMTPQLLSLLYDHGSNEVKSKLQQALSRLLTESIEQKRYRLLLEVIFSLNRLDVKFPVKVLLDFVTESAPNQKLQSLIRDAIVLLFETSHGTREIEKLFAKWFWLDPIPCGNNLALLIFSGLLSKNPRALRKLLPRLLQINDTLSPDERSDTYEILGAMTDNCTEQIFHDGLSVLPENVRLEFLALKQQEPDSYACLTEDQIR